MIKILFICHGNICRSPMAEYIMRDKLEKSGLGALVQVSSAATSREEIGNPVYPPAKKVLEQFGIKCDGHHARQVKVSDYDEYDFIIGMDSANMRGLMRGFGGDPLNKLHLMSTYATSYSGDVEDPWYTGEYEKVRRQIADGCEGLLWVLKKIV